MTNVKKTKALIKVRPQLIKRTRLVHLQLTVKDNAKGILETTETHLFDCLYRFNWSHIH
ncbi:MAG: hypothetical protein ACP8RL_06030 [cyanobacterium endosymbiont of Rhopalodia inflata]